MQFIAKKKDEKGIVLILSLILMTLILLLTLSAFEMVTINTRIADNHIRDLQALYVAEAGVEHAINQLRSKVTSDIPTTSFGPGDYAVDIGDDGDDDLIYSIDSYGTAYNNSSRRIEVWVELYKAYGSAKPYVVSITSWEEI